MGDVLYKITYIERNISQIKELISRERFDLEFTPYRIAIHKLECQKPPKSEKENLRAWETALWELEKEFREAFPNEIFVVDSPLYNAMETGILTLPKIQGGCHLAKIEKLCMYN